MRRATVKVLLKPSGIPDAEVIVASDEQDGQRVVMVYIKAIDAFGMSDVVVRLALSLEATGELIAQLTKEGGRS